MELHDAYAATFRNVPHAHQLPAAYERSTSLPGMSAPMDSMRLPQEVANAQMLAALRHLQACQTLTSAQAQRLHQLSIRQRHTAPLIPAQLAAADDSSQVTPTPSMHLPSGHSLFEYMYGYRR